MAISSPPPAPQRGDRATFSSRVDAFLLWLVSLPAQLNAFLSSISALAAGGANSFVYTFDTGIADSDPGTGKLRLGSSTQNTAVVMRIDNMAGNGGDITLFLLALAAGTSNVKASVRLQKVGDATTYLLFDITGVTNASGYLNLTLTPRASTSASPFAANDTLAVFFDPKGDRGDGGNTPTQAEIITAVGTLPISSGGTAATTAAGARANLGLGSVDNTSDSSKPVSTAQANAIATKVSKIGDMMTGPLRFAKGVSIKFDDGVNNPHDLVYLSNDNFTNVFDAGGNGIRFYNQPGTMQLAAMSPSGLFSAVVVAETSDERKKTNWRVLSDAQLDALAELEKVGVFDWVNGSGTALGVSAQAIQAIVPEAVHEDEHGELSVAYSGLTFAMAHGALRRATRK